MEVFCCKTHHESWAFLVSTVCVLPVAPFHIFKVVLKFLLDIANSLVPVSGCWVWGDCYQGQVEMRVEPINCKEGTLPHGHMVDVV